MKLTPTKEEILTVLGELNREEHLNVGEIVDKVSYGKRSVLENIQHLEDDNLVKREKVGREHHISLNHDHLDIVSNITKRRRDVREINNTQPQNISLNYRRKNEENYSSAIYKSLGVESIFNRNITVTEENVPIYVLLEKIIDKVEDRQHKELKKQASNIFDELIEEYNVREKLPKNHKRTVVNAVCNNLNDVNESYGDFDYGHLPAISIRPEYIFLIHSPAVIMDLSGGTVEMEDIEEARDTIEQDLKKMDEGKPVLEEPSNERLVESLRAVSVFTKEEVEFFKDFFSKVSERKQGKPIVTVTKPSNSPIPPVKQDTEKK